MNIFLLFLTTLFMIGYYILYSPSQNMTNAEAGNVVQMSDLRSIAECVIGMQNAKMNDIDYNDPCVARYGVVGKYVCAKVNNNNIVPEDCWGDPDINYIVSYSNQLPASNYGLMLEIIEKYYPDKGSFGIYENHEVITAGTTGHVTLDSVVYSQIGENGGDAENGRLVYAMQYRIPYPYQPPAPPGCTVDSAQINLWYINNRLCDPRNPDYDSMVAVEEGTCPACAYCPENYIAVIRYGRWMCEEANNPPFTCPAGKIPCLEKKDVNLCCDIEENTCDKLAQLCAEQELIADCDAMQCIPDPSDCDENCLITAENYVTAENHCICPQEDEDPPALQCGAERNFVYTHAQLLSALPTNRIIGRNTCPTCLIQNGTRYNPETDEMEPVCVPDPSKMYSRSCSDGYVSQSTCPSKPIGDPPRKAVYYGFQSTSNTDCIPNSNGGFYTDLLYEKIKAYIPEDKQDGKWHCMNCPNGINTEASWPPYVIVCKP